jgi:hypothetical protein
MFQIQIDKVLFKQEVNVGKYYICLIEIRYNDYKQSSIQTNDENRIVKISLGDIDNIKIFDVVTDYLLLKLKYENNIKS